MSRSNPDVSQRTNSSAGFSPELLIHLNRSQRVVREQLAQQLRAMIRDGRLPAGARLPPTRVMARDLDVARSVVVDAYQQLIADGYLSARQGSGTRVLPVSSDRPPAVDSRSAEVTSAIGLFAGLPDPALFPPRAECCATTAPPSRRFPTVASAIPGPPAYKNCVTHLPTICPASAASPLHQRTSSSAVGSRRRSLSSAGHCTHAASERSPWKILASDYTARPSSTPD